MSLELLHQEELLLTLLHLLLLLHLEQELVLLVRFLHFSSFLGFRFADVLLRHENDFERKEKKT